MTPIDRWHVSFGPQRRNFSAELLSSWSYDNGDVSERLQVATVCLLAAVTIHMHIPHRQQGPMENVQVILLQCRTLHPPLGYALATYMVSGA